LIFLAVALMGIGSIAAAQCGMHAKAQAAATPETPSPAPVAAPGCGKSMMPYPCASMMDCREDPLGLTEDQHKAAAKIHQDARAALMAVRKDLMRLRNELAGHLLKDEPDGAALRKLVQKMGDLRTQMQIQRLEQRLAIRKLLTPEQRDRMLLQGGPCGPRGGGRGCGPCGPRCGGRGFGPCGPRGGCGHEGMMMGMPGCGPDLDEEDDLDLGFLMGPDDGDALMWTQTPAAPAGCKPGCPKATQP
jgi:Spy/CpxP family protein refolding chaperone